MRRLSRAQRLPWIGRWWPGARAIRAGIAADVAILAGALGLGTLLQRRPARLSGGQRQRVALGRAMVRRPKVFLMDEPLSNLDAKLRTQTRAEIAELHRTLGATFVYVTHDQVEAMTMSDRVALMHDGRILQVGAPQSIYDDPQDLRVAEFIGTPKINVLAAAPGERGLRVQGFEWPLAPAAAAGPVSVAVRPEWWTLQPGPSPADGRHCVVTGRIRHLEALGSETLVHVQADGCAEPLIARITPAQAAALTVGLGVTLAAPADRVLLFDADGRRVAARPTAPLREALVG
jgi:multiple sugar transport system ATP-binding protein